MRHISIILAGTVLLSQVQAATLKVDTKDLGSTPNVIGYNISSHFPAGSNTHDWWRYSGVSGARGFTRPGLPSHNDGVKDQASFLARRVALRADPLNPKLMDWTAFLKRYDTYSFTRLRRLGIDILVNSTAGMEIKGEDDWAGKWEMWKLYYIQAFYLGREFGVERYQMYNEPNHGGGKLSTEEYMMKLKLASDAIQSALADVNRIYKRSLKPMISAPVNSGNPVKNYPSWGRPIVKNMHTDFLGRTDPSFNLVHIYSYQSYNSSPAGFGGTAAELHELLEKEMAPGAPLPVAITEFNVFTGARFSSMAETLDMPELYARLGAISVNLMANGISEMYCFRFPRVGDGNGNGMHYVDGSTEPNNVGGVTKAGEVWRLFNKAFAPGRRRLLVSKDKAAEGLDVHASHEPVNQRYHLFSANFSDKPVPLDLDLSAWKIPAGNRVIVEEVSEGTYGAIRVSVNLAQNRVVGAGVQPANSVWLLSVSALPQSKVQSLTATDDAEVRDGAHAGLNFGSAKTLLVRNDPKTADNRRAVFLKFDLTGVDLENLLTAELVLNAASATRDATVQAHVYGLSDNSWKQSSIVWNNAPNLRAGTPAGNTIPHRVVTGQGDTAFIVGQLVATSAQQSGKRLDVTGFIRGQSKGAASFLISQDPRWNVTLPSKESGDTQADGIQISSTEGGNGPGLQLTFKAQ